MLMNLKEDIQNGIVWPEYLKTEEEVIEQLK